MRPLLAGLAGAFVAVLGGLIGLGGAEFRLPVLTLVFLLATRVAVPINLAVSFATVSVSLLGRVLFTDLSGIPHLGVEIVALIAGGVCGARIGVGLAGWLSDHALERLVAVLLLAIAALLIAEAVLTVPLMPGLPADAVLRGAAGVVAGVAIGVVASLLGVAGGELLIPTLMFLFGADIKTAGTASLMVSLPTMAVALLRYRRQGAFADPALLRGIALPMALGSVAGGLVGAALVRLAPVAGLKLLLGAVLLASTLKMLRR